LTATLRSAPDKDRIEAIVPVAHGAAAVLLDTGGEVIWAPDYEDPQFETVGDEYETHRDSFRQTLSPRLPLGLNLGRQLFFLQNHCTADFRRVAHVLLYPQYWAWRLSGTLASEVTSLGCHTDLWWPRRKCLSNLTRHQGWAAKLPPTRFAGDTLGRVAAAAVAATGLRPECRVVCGIHDSNASYLQPLLRWRDQPFAVVSSGTWTVVMANKADTGLLDPNADMLANVDAFGSPVCTARFMGGREYEAIASTRVQPSREGLEAVLRRGSMALPSFAAAGPFAGRPGGLVQEENLGDADRAALASAYVALMADLLIETLQVSGDVLIDGPLARNPLFGGLLAAWRPMNRIVIENPASSRGAALCHLAGFGAVPVPETLPVNALQLDGLEAYRAAWRECVLGG
jgi:sugar (pentulose or hexulose) kinase